MSKLFWEIVPIGGFFIIYKLYNVFAATAFAMATMVAQVGYSLFKGKRPDNMTLITLGMVLLFGGATLFFHNELFIKWKPTALYWLLGAILLLAPLFIRQTIPQKMLSKNMQLSNKAWNVVNRSWYGFFFLLGALNIVIAYRFDTNTWVNFKLFGTTVLTLGFAVFQAWLVNRLIQAEQNVAQPKRVPFHDA